MRVLLIVLVVLALLALPCASWTQNHPKHIVKPWVTKYKGATFLVVQLPRCNHVEAVISYEPGGEKKERAKKRLGGFAVCSGNFYDCRTNLPVDYFRRNGVKVKGREVGRYFLAIHPDGRINLSQDYQLLNKNKEIDAVALGQMIKPFRYDGFKTVFIDAETDRMGMGFTSGYIYIVQSRTNIRTLASFFANVLKCDEAINTDGGHVVKGKSPFHIVFRWHKAPKNITAVTKPPKQ
ncbi:TPA: hypothetical protein DD449_00660 [Candidatus Berkelbacteria bacterium]|uniref:Phosphodiester glycosidase domain-containing protein n=1 Tax=Berkelbacteria bacterium GW2011_GWE1_39_12 TaxID=1618337 RepID=A0A0G4B5R7_9BACT|nr:MAG: hypothetical protein UT28_C0001G0956 [Berkelbacteria bacterium GW2011_GWE1_39_12]HBO60182.1 hypothetical protein [Candidatus Berkelbacteria bacterium]